MRCAFTGDMFDLVSDDGGTHILAGLVSLAHDLWGPVENRTSRCLFEADSHQIDDRPITLGGAYIGNHVYIEQIKRCAFEQYWC